MLRKHSLGFYTFSFIYVLSIVSIGTWIERSQAVPLFFAYCSAFASYLLLQQNHKQPTFLFGLGLLVRIGFFFSLPTLSDDIYRFIWDGTLLKNGIHPFAELPGYYLTHQVDGIDRALYERLNSPKYFTIYPPINQFVFWIAVSLGSGWLFAANVIRVLLLLADIGSFVLLKKLLISKGKSAHLAFLYFLNPLTVLEFVGNIHFEGIVIFCLLLGIYYYEKKKGWHASLGLGLAIGNKLLPFIYLPYLFFTGLSARRWWVAIAAGLVALLTLIPMFNATFINGMQASLELYFRKFEFNASIYFIAREIGTWIYGYNAIARIGPLLSIVSFVTIIGISIWASFKKWEIGKAFLYILSTYLLLTTTVHPWYIIPLIAFGITQGYRFPIVWSLFIFFTYMGYTKTGFELPMWIVVMEYIALLFSFFLDIKWLSKQPGEVGE